VSRVERFLLQINTPDATIYLWHECTEHSDRVWHLVADQDVLFIGDVSFHEGMKGCAASAGDARDSLGFLGSDSTLPRFDDAVLAVTEHGSDRGEGSTVWQDVLTTAVHFDRRQIVVAEVDGLMDERLLAVYLRFKFE
jgi:hypothetical protein